MGKKAAEILFTTIESGDKKGELQQILLKPKLIIRQSCGAKHTIS
jgi:DNA-binding LacI/PurR family transcriptional regulator